MKIAFKLLFLFFCPVLFAQKPADDLHLKHSIKQADEQIQFSVLEYQEKGVSNYSKEKVYFWFKSQKIMATQGGASGQLLHGKLEGFYPNKQLSQKGYFQKGLKNGEWLYWNSNGVLILEENWRNGKKTGIEKQFDDHGVLLQSTGYKFNRTERKTTDSLIVNYTNSKKTISLYDNKGQVKSVSSYKEGLLDGKQLTYENGKLLKTENYKAGKLQDSKKSMKDFFKKRSEKEKKPKEEKKPEKKKEVRPDSKKEKPVKTPVKKKEKSTPNKK